MIKHKLIRILQILSAEEWSSLRKYILMNTSEKSELYSLFTIIRKRINIISTNDDLYKINSKHFSQLSAKSFSNVMSKITSQTENWIAYQSILTNENEKDVALVKYYNRNGLYKEADNTLYKLEKRLNGISQVNSDKSRYLAQVYYYQYYSDNPVKYNKSRDLLRELVTHFSLWIKDQLQIYNTELYSWGNLMNIEYQDLKKNLGGIINSLPNSESSIHLDALQLLITKGGLANYNRVKNILIQDELVEGSDLHIILTMYMIAQSHTIWEKDKSKSNNVVKDAYDYGLSSGVLLLSNQLPIHRFIAIVYILANKGTYENTIKFINKWYTKASSKDKESIKYLAYASACVYLSREEEIATHLNKVETEHTDVRYLRHALTCISLYNDRKSQYDILINYLNNFSRIIKRNNHKTIQNTTDLYSNFVRVVTLLIKSEFENINLNNIEIGTAIFKTWLLNEINKRATK